MKKILKFITVFSLSFSPSMAITACNNAKKELTVETLNPKFGTAIGWYRDENNSNIMQSLAYLILLNVPFYFILTDAAKLVFETNFKDKLLVTTDNINYKAKSEDATNYLKELGYQSGNTTTNYSVNEVTAINGLTATITSSGEAKIEPNETNSDYMFLKNNCIINIANNNNIILKSYTAFTKDKQNLEIANYVAEIITESNVLVLNNTSGYQQGQAVTNFKLQFKAKEKETQWNMLVKTLNTTATLKWYDAPTGGKLLTGNFSNSTHNYLEIIFNNTINTTPVRIDCGQAPV